MLLKDCPVGSVVRCVSVFGKRIPYPHLPNWDGEFQVFLHNEEHVVKDGSGDIRISVSNNPLYQFEIVSMPKPAKQITLNGTTYNLNPVTPRQTITIDGVVYEMEEA